MKRKALLLIAACMVCIFLLHCLGGPAINPTDDELRTIADQMDRMVESLDGDWEKVSEAKVIPVTYTDSAGDTIIYHICKTTYFQEVPAESTELDLNAVSCVIDPETAEESEIRTVHEGPAILYQKEERAYLCWTDTPEYTYILEYSPAHVTEAEILKMAESTQ